MGPKLEAGIERGERRWEGRKGGREPGGGGDSSAWLEWEGLQDFEVGGDRGDAGPQGSRGLIRRVKLVRGDSGFKEVNKGGDPE